MRKSISGFVANPSWGLPIAVGFVLVGCGGGGAGSPAGGGTGPTQTTQVGPIGVTFSGHPKPLTTAATGSVSAVGQAGASYSTISYNPAHNLAGTFLLFGRYLGIGGQVFTLAMNGSATPSVLIHTGENQCPSISTSGVVAFLNQSSSPLAIQTCLPDGSQEKTVGSGTYGYPSISPNGATIAFADVSDRLYTMPTSGGTPTLLYGGGAVVDGSIVWSPNGTQIAFSGFNGTSGYNAYTIASTGGAVTNITPTSWQNGNVIVNSWSADGNTIAVAYTANGATYSSVALISPKVGFDNILSPANYNDSYPTFSPDGSEIAFYRSNANGAAPGIYVSDVAGTSPQLVLADPPSNGASSPVSDMVWSPYPASKNFIGAGGTILAGPVSGFLAAQTGSQFGSILTFTTTTPSTATLTPSSSNGNGGPLIYTLGGDSITNISYANVYNGAHSSIPLSSTPSAVVTIDAVTGFVDYVIPALAGKAHPMVAKSSGTATTLTGQFPAIYDSTGKNLAPNGATSVQIERKTGKLVSFS